MVSSRRLALVLFLSCVACGGGKQPLSPTDDAPDGSDGTATDPPAPETPAASASGDAPAPVSCLVNSICSETTLGGKDATDAKDRCKAANGEPRDGACARDDVAATCVVESKQLTMYFYKDKNPQATRGVLKGGKGACTSAGGVFTPTAKGGGGGGKKKPGKKK